MIIANMQVPKTTNVTTKEMWKYDTHLRAVLGNGGAKAFDNASIDVEQVISGHAWFAGHTGRDYDYISTLQGLAKLCFSHEPSHLTKKITCYNKTMTGKNKE